MTHKERMLAAIRGRPVDQIPWAPRLDLWYRANRLAGTLPVGVRHSSLEDLVADLGWAFHAVVPNFQDLRSPEDDLDRAVGVYNLHFMPHRTIFEDLERTVRREGDRTIVEYRTPVGTLRTAVLYDDAMRRAGITITHVAEHAFKTSADYAALGHLFEHARVVPNYEGYSEFGRRIGDQGIAVAFLSLAASPMHLIQRELMPLDTFFFEMSDHPEELAALAEKIGGYWTRMFDVAAECPAEVFLLGANYDASVTYPPFFRDHIRPWLRRFGERLHARGKFLLTHTDGENTGLVPHYLDAGFDIADSVCPSPMTKLRFCEVREAFAGRVTIMGGIPSIVLLPGSMPDREFHAFLDGFFDQIGRGDHLILGVSDTTPPGADFGRLREIAERVAAFGPVVV